VTNGPRWREQYDRMFRWYRRLDLNVEHIVGRGEDALVDTFYAFAQSCYRLVDWLENDRSQHVRRGPAEAYVDSCPVLAYCRDICNGSKHARLEAKNVQTKMERTIIGEDEFGPVPQPQLFVHWGGEFIEAENFAAECIGEWNRFLHTRGLLTSQ